MNNVLTAQEHALRLIKYLGFKLQNRGRRENELLLSKVDVNALPYDLLILLEMFLDEADYDIFAWLVQSKSLPRRYQALHHVLFKKT